MMKDDLDCFCRVERVCSQCEIVRQKKKKRKKKTRWRMWEARLALFPAARQNKRLTRTPQFSTDGQD